MLRVPERNPDKNPVRVPKILAFLIPEILSDLVLGGRNSSLLPSLLGKREGRREEDAGNACSKPGIRRRKWLDWRECLRDRSIASRKRIRLLMLTTLRSGRCGTLEDPVSSRISGNS